MTRSYTLAFGVVLAVLGLLYFASLQVIPNGSSHYYMIDVGETQVVLNTWGTLHATGYPLYVITSSLINGLLVSGGLSAAATPALVSLLWSMLALAVMYALALHLTGSLPAAVLVTLIFGLTRTVWVHSVIAEVYSFTLLIQIGLIALALWRHVPGRLYWLALLGGIGIAHHRAIAFMIPALIIATWPQLSYEIRRKPGRLLIMLGLGLLGFLPYLYMPLRAASGAAWVYGDPGTWSGFWAQFFGSEAGQFFGVPDLSANIERVNTVLLTDLTTAGLIIGLIGLLIGLINPERRRIAAMLVVNAAAAYTFSVFVYSDILSALILIITASIVIGWLLLIERALDDPDLRIYVLFVVIALSLFIARDMVVQNLPFTNSLTRDTTGLETIVAARDVPEGSALMLPWGTRHTAVGMGKDVLGLVSGFDLLDHNADFRAVLDAGQRLVAPDYTFFAQPQSWWEEKLGASVYLDAAAPGLVEIRTTPTVTALASGAQAVRVLDSELVCEPSRLIFSVVWVLSEAPERDLSVFVHLLNSAGEQVAQDSRSAPVYGLRPLTGWVSGEQVRDIYVLPRLSTGAQIRYGFFYQDANGAFVNEYTFETSVDCNR